MPRQVVSRETMEMLEAYADELKRWNRTINLVSGAEIGQDFWQRHIEDSLQILDHAPDEFDLWIDAGSGGGLPGLVVAISMKADRPDAQVVLVESDKRKATFLRSIIRKLSLNAEVSTDRVESLDPKNADVFSARALAPLSKLLGFAQRHLSDDGVALLLKGANFQKEIDDARAKWDFKVTAHPSRTQPDARVLEVREISTKGQI